MSAGDLTGKRLKLTKCFWSPSATARFPQSKAEGSQRRSSDISIHGDMEQTEEAGLNPHARTFCPLLTFRVSPRLNVSSVIIELFRLLLVIDF